jgi:eukaryotic-like serine/threonine-protein kinase
VDVIEASAGRSKVCAACGGRYPGDALYCPTDGSPLQSAAAVEHSPPDPYLGQEISGHIEIRQLVGVGAMGRVYRAFQRGIDRDVAVKILHRELSANAQLVSRFTREAKVASRLQHPNVVQVLLAGQLPDRALYMVMEYLDGLSLQSALAAVGGAFQLPRALHVALQLCEATGEAHAQGIVHRDLKPENVMLVRRGSDPDFVKVLDFGIARMNWGEQSVATAAGLIFGTARYISPEGAQGNAVGPASDVYAIGTLLYQMLSGRTPFDGDQAVGLLVQQIHDAAPHLQSIPRAAYVPDPISDVIMATLAKDPAHREPDARALGQAIFDAAKLAGLSPDEFSRPMMKRTPSAIKMAPIERTKQLELTPDLAARLTPTSGDPARESASDARANANSNANGSGGGLGQRVPTAATVKWEPPTEFQARLAQGMRTASTEDRTSGIVTPTHDERRSRPRMQSNVDETIDDLMLDAQTRERQGSSPTGAPPRAPSFPGREEPQDSSARRVSESNTRVPRTVPGEPDAPLRTHYTPPLPPPPPVHGQRPASSPEHLATPLPRAHAHAHDSEARDRRSRGWLVVVVCFVLGAAIALGWAVKVGKVGGSELDEERFVARATDAMFKNHFHEPPGDNVKDLTDEGLKRWPNDRRLLDIRVRAANELTSQAIAQRSAGDVLEALKLARIAHDLDPHDASAKRLVDQYEGELASFAPSAAPTLTRPPDRPAPPTTKASVPPAPPTPATPNNQRADYKALVDVSNAAPRLGQPVELTARVAPPKGDFDAPGFTIVGPGIAGGVRMPATAVGGGVFKASYAFLDPGRFEVAFTTQEGGKQIAAKRVINAGTPAPVPSTAPTPTTTGSVKWM